MPATFLLVLFGSVLALAAPLLAAISLALLFVARWRRLAVQLILFGLLAGVIASAGWLIAIATYFPAEPSNWAVLSGIFGAGFSTGMVARTVWHLLRRTRPNNSFKPNPLRGSA
jgi:hypothetical protein